MPTLSDFTAQTLDGREQDLGEYAGKVVLVVNTASQCGFTPQFGGLERLWDEFGDDGLVVLGFPCNQFGNQDPGSDEQIGEFCQANYGVTFPMFSKVDVNGSGRAPLYTWLTGQATKPDGPGDIKWNFAKFVIDKSGNVVARFSPVTPPTSESLLEAIEGAID